ncbi:MAG: undecaprenyl-phosphate glucose phosphotransferase [Gammaproteobacteria bacterium]|nr:undecaprenyl-phosphate glucose phosphotransferase [Gammaproteobacteria bacterium]
MNLIVVLIDLATVLLAGVSAWWMVSPYAADAATYGLLVLLAGFSLIPVLSLSGLYRSFRAQTVVSWLSTLTVAWFMLASAVLLCLWAFKLSEDFSRLWLGTWLLLGWFFAICWRLIAYGLLQRLRAMGYDRKHIVIVGAGRLGQDLLSTINASPWSGFEVAAFFDDDSSKVGSLLNGILVVSADQLSVWLESHSVDEIWFTLPLRAEPRLQQLLHALRHTTANIRYVPNLSSLRLLNHAPREVLGFSMLDLSVSPMTEPMNRLLKSLEDKVISALILLLISPIMLLLAIGVKLSSPGPVFYLQQRVGLNGELFDMLKFRSMPVDVEKDGVEWGSAAAKTNTWFGAFIRKTSLDELPQFINVLKGDMSIVGPRPERPMFVEQFKDEIPGYMQKHMVKAGITGWAQIHGWRGDTCLKTRIEFDLWYIENWSLWLDIKIIIMTLFKGFVHKNAR